MWKISDGEAKAMGVLASRFMYFSALFVFGTVVLGWPWNFEAVAFATFAAVSIEALAVAYDRKG